MKLNIQLFGGGDETGYNCEKVEALRDVINSTAQKAGENIVEKLHSGIIVPMSSAWYAPEAQEFFNQFAEQVKGSGEAVTEVFNKFRGFVQDAGTDWASNTGGTAPQLAAIDNVELILNVSDIQPDNGGTVEIFESEATKVAGSLGEVQSEIQSDLQNIAGDLTADTAFLGHGQAEAVQSCFEQISGEVSKIFGYLEDLSAEIEKAVNKYKSVAEEITSAFNS